jgi:hypothetical protein
MATSTINSNLHVIGTITASAGVTPSTNSITDSHVQAGAGIAASKIEHQYTITYGQTGTGTAATIPIHVAYGDGEIVSFRAGSIAIAVGAATCTVDLKKNGSSVLSSVITLDSANTARVMEAGTLSSSTYSNDDFFEVVVTATAGGGTIPTGLAVQAVLREDAAP